MLKKIIIVVLFSLFLTSCAFKTTYRFADWLIAWEVDDYIVWDKHQQVIFDQLLDDTLTWHRQTQLKEYGQFLMDIQALGKQPVTLEQLYEYREQLQGFWKAVMLKIQPDIVLLLSGISDLQLEKLEKNIESKISKDHKKLANKDSYELKKDTLKSMEDSLSQFVGKVTIEQKELISAWAESRNNKELEDINNRKHWSVLFIDAMKDRQSDSFNNQINQLFVYPQQLWLHEYAESEGDRVDKTFELLVKLQPTLTDKQWRNIDKKLGEWVSIFNDLSGNAEVTK